jgi:diguanylate cyclase
MKNHPIDTHAYQQNINTTHDVFSGIKALDQGIANHEVWINEVHQSLVCGNAHPNPFDLCEDAHCRCKFGQWLYGADTEALKDLEHFHYVVEKHLKMHALARKILTKSENKQRIDEDEYRDFNSLATGFKLDVRNLQYELMTQVCVVDHLTGAWNRYAMYSKLHQEKERQMRAGHCCTICMMDVDHFKRVNDNYGHSVGDLVLKSVIDFCRISLRKYDSIYRYGGEEFLFCLPDADLDEAVNIIERLCVSLGKHSISLPSGDKLFVTASFGIASMQENIAVDDCIQRADHALLCAKSQGRDCVCCWEDDSSASE